MCQALVFFFLAGNSIGTVLSTYVSCMYSKATREDPSVYTMYQLLSYHCCHRRSQDCNPEMMVLASRGLLD